MKIKILLITIFLLFTCLCKSQSTIYGSYLPENNAIGIRGDYKIPNKFYGMYVSGNYGDYFYSDGSYVKQNIRATWGVLLYNPNELVPNLTNVMGAGVNFNTYSEVLLVGTLVPHRARQFVSFEISNGIYYKWLAISLRYDFLRKERTIDIGIKF